MSKPPRKKSPRRRSQHQHPRAASNADAQKQPRRTERHARRRKGEPSALQAAERALDDLKALDVSVLDVRHLTTVTDTMIVACGRSDRHVRAIAGAVVDKCKREGYRPIGVEGEKSGEWVLVDLGDVVVHVMLPRTREFYSLEKLWTLSERDQAAEAGRA
ncbi:MAG TPA: ribosome silencing factor [Gammaproteobacteria bacterium]|jgi:ribosome-associated protein|nr:ribosome silencing factor [Gammaproteobacteria bacterium]